MVHDLEWLATVRARVGIVNGDWLLYGTGGLAVGQIEAKYTLNFPELDAFARDSKTETRVGWTVGAGAEVNMGLWSIKGEYLYYDLGTVDLSAQGVLAGVPRPVYFEPEFETQGHIGRIGINFRLD